MPACGGPKQIREYATPLPRSEAPSIGGLRFVPSIYQVALVAVLGAVFLVGAAPRLDTDLWWHLKVGQFIAEHHAVPARDYLSFTFAGRHWVDMEWLSELLLYALYSLAGLWGPLIGFAAVICATYALVYAAMVQQGVNRILSLFAISAGLVAATPALGARPQMMTLFFLAVYVLTLTRFMRSPDRRLLVVLPLCMLLWVNFHGGFALGLILLAVYLAGEVANFVTKHQEALAASDLRALAVASAASLAVTAINPIGLQDVLYPLVWLHPTAYSNFLSEWVSPNFHDPLFMVFEIMVLLLIGAALIGRSALNWTHLFLILVFTYLALSEARNVSVWTVVIGPLFALYLQRAAPSLAEQFPGVSYRRREVSGRLAPLLNLVFLVLVLLMYAVEASQYVNAAALKKNESTSYPYAAVRYLQHHSLPPRLFNSYGWGGYVIWYLSPRYQDFIDGRANTLFDGTIFDAYLSTYAAVPGWSAVLDRYRVQTVLIDSGSPLAQVLALSSGWQLTYHDSYAVIYVRR